jgi:hypothetical protein
MKSEKQKPTEDEVNEVNKTLLAELRKFKDNFEATTKSWKDLKNRLSAYRRFIDTDITEYLGEKLMPVMFSNLVKTHAEILKLEDDGSGSDEVIVATPKGLRQKWRSYAHSNHLSLKTLNQLFTKKYDELEKWFQDNLNRKRVNTLRQFKEAFVKGYNQEWGNARNYDKQKNAIEIKVPVGKHLFFVDSEGDNIIFKDDFYVENIILRMNVRDGEVVMAFTTDKFKEGDELSFRYYGSGNDLNRFIIWNDSDYLAMFSFREIIAEVNSAIDKANERLVNEEEGIQKWFVELKQNLSAYVSLINL